MTSMLVFRMEKHSAHPLSQAQGGLFCLLTAFLCLRNMTDLLKALISTDSIKIFSITFFTLVTVYLQNTGFIQKIATIFQGLFKDSSRTTLEFQEPLVHQSILIRL